MSSAISVAVSVAAPVSAAAPEGSIVRFGSHAVVPNSYIVMFKNSITHDHVRGKAAELAARFGGRTGHVFDNAVGGFAVNMPEAAARRLAADPSVAYVQENLVYYSKGTQEVFNGPLDRIDQRSLAGNDHYNYPSTASAVDIYILDTGVRFTHQDFGGRAISGPDEIDGDNVADDPSQVGHGTEVASLAGGTTYGSAKGVRLVSVRVLDALGQSRPTGTSESVIAGVNWVTSQHPFVNIGRRAVVNMSLGTLGVRDPALDAAVTNSIARGITYVAAAGDEKLDACTESPADVPGVITVGSTAFLDDFASFSNFGSCVDIFAPGLEIPAASNKGDTATSIDSGTSMSSPLVAGAAAMVLAGNSSFTPAQVQQNLVSVATPSVTGAPAGTTNKMLFVDNPKRIDAPIQFQPALFGSETVLSWQDQSTNEDGFTVSNENGDVLATVNTRDKAGTGYFYNVVTLATTCYIITPFDNTHLVNGTGVSLLEGVPSRKFCGVGGTIAPPRLAAPTSLGSGTITLNFTDRSTNEDGFKVQRCDGSLVADVRTTDKAGTGRTYTVTTDLTVPRCYFVKAYADEFPNDGSPSDSLALGDTGPFPDPDFSIVLSNSSGTVRNGQSVTTQVNLTSVQGAVGPLTLFVNGLPAGVTGSFSPGNISASAPTSTLTLTADNSAVPGVYPLTITTDPASGGGGGIIFGRTTAYLLTIKDNSSVSLSENTGEVGVGGSVSTAVSVTGTITGTQTLLVQGLPAGVTASFAPSQVSAAHPTSILTLTASSAAAEGVYNLIITTDLSSGTAKYQLSVISLLPPPPSS